MEIPVGKSYNGKSLATTLSESFFRKTFNFSEPAMHCNKLGGVAGSRKSYGAEKREW